MTLPPTIPTYRVASTGIWTRPDNVFLSEAAVHALISCDVAPEEMTNGADHIPVSTILSLSLLQAQPSPKRNFRTVDWETFNKHFAEELEKIPPPCELTTQQLLNMAVQDITRTIQLSIEKAIPPSQPYPASKRWWTSELSEMKKALNRLSAKSYKFRAIPDDDSHRELRELRTRY
ncbi:hypothetical protein F5051DRAFT_310491, partial [Lentinula edodes]